MSHAQDLVNSLPGFLHAYHEHQPQRVVDANLPDFLRSNSHLAVSLSSEQGGDTTSYRSTISHSSVSTVPPSVIFDPPSPRSPRRHLTTVDRPSLPENIAYTLQRYPAASSYVLPCEFSRLTDCAEVFHPEEVAVWKEHIAQGHLRGVLPERCLCWYCDAEFAAHHVQGDREVNFERRMEHIVSHLGTYHMSSREAVERIRPDFHFLEHARRGRHITEQTYDDLRTWGGQHEDFQGPGFVPPERAREQHLRSRVVNDGQQEKRKHRRQRRRGE